jgi:hypothetical protein
VHNSTDGNGSDGYDPDMPLDETVVDKDFERRWKAWRAHGAAQDRKARRQIMFAFPAIAVVMALVAAVMLG